MTASFISKYIGKKNTKPSLLFSLDSKYRSWFPYEDFNQIQQKCLHPILQSDENIIISAPTGSGKTSLFEFAMIREFQHAQSSFNGKILYLAPMRALCTEKASAWKQKLEQFGTSCIELIGGDKAINDSDIEDADLIISTPEKWDYITRSTNIIQRISLILVNIKGF